MQNAAEVPPSTPVYVASEKELEAEAEAIAAALGPAADWQKRIAAMERINGLLAGGATEFTSGFDAALRTLRDPLTRQVVDRCTRWPAEGAMTWDVSCQWALVAAQERFRVLCPGWISSYVG